MSFCQTNGSSLFDLKRFGHHIIHKGPNTITVFKRGTTDNQFKYTQADMYCKKAITTQITKVHEKDSNRNDTKKSAPTQSQFSRGAQQTTSSNTHKQICIVRKPSPHKSQRCMKKIPIEMIFKNLHPAITVFKRGTTDNQFKYTQADMYCKKAITTQITKVHEKDSNRNDI